MRKWGIVVSLVYAVIVVGLLVPALLTLATDNSFLSRDFSRNLSDMYGDLQTWFFVAIFLSGQIILLFLSVDTSRRWLRPRAHIAVSCAVTAVFAGFLTFSVICSLAGAVESEKVFNLFTSSGASIAISIAIFWIVWGVVFYLYLRNSSDAITRAVAWLLRGSVLELLIVVPCHVIVRRRGDCSAPIVTGFGISSGIAIMLLCFGPSVLFLYKKRLDAYPDRAATRHV